MNLSRPILFYDSPPDTDEDVVDLTFESTSQSEEENHPTDNPHNPPPPLTVFHSSVRLVPFSSHCQEFHLNLIPNASPPDTEFPLTIHHLVDDYPIPFQESGKLQKALLSSFVIDEDWVKEDLFGHLISQTKGKLTILAPNKTSAKSAEKWRKTLHKRDSTMSYSEKVHQTVKKMYIIDSKYPNVHKILNTTELPLLAKNPETIYRTFHPKILILYFEKMLRIVISSANLDIRSWFDIGQMIWFVDLPLSSKSNKCISTTKTGFEFYHTLKSFLYCHLTESQFYRQESHFISSLADFDFSRIKSPLILSLPGTFYSIPERLDAFSSEESDIWSASATAGICHGTIKSIQIPNGDSGKVSDSDFEFIHQLKNSFLNCGAGLLPISGNNSSSSDISSTQSMMIALKMKTKVIPFGYFASSYRWTSATLSQLSTFQLISFPCCHVPKLNEKKCNQFINQITQGREKQYKKTQKVNFLSPEVSLVIQLCSIRKLFSIFQIPWSRSTLSQITLESGISSILSSSLQFEGTLLDWTRIWVSLAISLLHMSDFSDFSDFSETKKINLEIALCHFHVFFCDIYGLDSLAYHSFHLSRELLDTFPDIDPPEKIQYVTSSSGNLDNMYSRLSLKIKNCFSLDSPLFQSCEAPPTRHLFVSWPSTKWFLKPGLQPFQFAHYCLNKRPTKTNVLSMISPFEQRHSERSNLPDHSKCIYAPFTSSHWSLVYAGSHNFSEAAWGSTKMQKISSQLFSNLTGFISMTGKNCEVGVLSLVSNFKFPFGVGGAEKSFYSTKEQALTRVDMHHYRILGKKYLDENPLMSCSLLPPYSHPYLPQNFVPLYPFSTSLQKTTGTKYFTTQILSRLENIVDHSVDSSKEGCHILQSVRHKRDLR